MTLSDIQGQAFPSEIFHSFAAVNKISTDVSPRAVPLQTLSFLYSYCCYTAISVYI